MAQTRKIQKLLSLLVKNLEPEQMMKMLDPCTKLTITLKMARGYLKFSKEGAWEITRIRAIDLVKTELISETLWEKIFSLKAFSTTSRQASNKKLREALLELKANGEIDVKKGTRYQSRINVILRKNNVECRVVFCWNENNPANSCFRIREIE